MTQAPKGVTAKKRELFLEKATMLYADGYNKNTTCIFDTQRKLFWSGSCMNPDDNYHEITPTKIIRNTQSGVNGDLNLVANARGLPATATSLTRRKKLFTAQGAVA